MATDAFIGEIMMFGGNYAPIGWMPCDGRLLPIAVYDSLFTILGTTYGGDGESTFGLPDLRGRCIVGAGTGAGLTPRVLGTPVGAETVTVALSQLPTHSHSLNCSTQDANAPTIADRVPAVSTNHYANVPSGGASSHPDATSTFGLGQAHNNMQPFQAIQYCICVEGIYPPFP